MKQKLKEILIRYIDYIIGLSYVIVVMIVGFLTAREINGGPVAIMEKCEDCRVWDQIINFCEMGIKESDRKELRPTHDDVCTKYWDYVSSNSGDTKTIIKTAKKYPTIFK